MDNVVMSSNVRGCGWLDACGSILHNGRGGQSKAASNYDAAIPSTQILTTERGAVGVASCTRRRSDKVGISSRRLFGRPDGFLIGIKKPKTLDSHAVTKSSPLLVWYVVWHGLVSTPRSPKYSVHSSLG